MMGYDQWKTASPYDDEPDIFEEAERWLKVSEDPNVHHQTMTVFARSVIEGLLQALDDEGVYDYETRRSSR